MVPIELDYEGSLRVRARHVPSSSELETDAPTDNEGQGARFSPTDLVATALASCALTTMGIVARRRGLDITGTRARVEKHMTTDGPRRIARLSLEIIWPGQISESARPVLERAAHVCPVRESLSPDVEVTIHFRVEGDVARWGVDA